jgi:hypothetical protein
MNQTPSQPAPSPTIPAKKKARHKATSTSATAKSKSRQKGVASPSNERIALRAYFIGERRRSLGISGDETSDWVQAEQELLEEPKSK